MDLKVVVERDPDPFDPRTEDENLGTMVCFHKRYTLGDRHDLKHDDFNGWDEMERYLKEDLGALCVLPLYLYDHSGITISTHPFGCRWDSGQIGFIYTTREDIDKIMGYKRLTKKKLAEIEKSLIAEVEVYDQYLTGDVWQFSITDEESDTVLESGCGFFGEAHCREEAESCRVALDRSLDHDLCGANI